MQRFLTVLILSYLPLIAQAQSSHSVGECHKFASVGYVETDMVGYSQAVSDAIKKAFEMADGGMLNKGFGFAVLINVDSSFVTTRVTGFGAGTWQASVPPNAVATFHTLTRVVLERGQQDAHDADYSAAIA